MPEALIGPPQRMKRQIPPIPAAIAAAMKQRVYIFNVGPWEHHAPMGTMGTFIIPACPEGQEYSAPVAFRGEPGIPALIPETVVDAVEGYTVTYKWDFSTEGDRVARDIVRMFEKKGVFLAAGPVPTEQELEAAKTKLYDLYDERVKAADKAYEVNGGMEVGDNGKSYSAITSDDVFAAKALGLDKPWARKNQKMVPCEGCGQPVAPQAVRCPHTGCGAILNEEKARKLFPHLFQTETEKRGPGRPRKDEVA